MTNDNDGGREVIVRRLPRPSAKDIAETFGLTREAAERLLARPPNETQVLMAIAAMLEAEMRPGADARVPNDIGATLDGPAELLTLYARMSPAQRAALLAAARALAPPAAAMSRSPTKD